jgi:hypothetical protein
MGAAMVVLKAGRRRRGEAKNKDHGVPWDSPPAEMKRLRRDSVDDGESQISSVETWRAAGASEISPRDPYLASGVFRAIADTSIHSFSRFSLTCRTIVSGRKHAAPSLTVSPCRSLAARPHCLRRESSELTSAERAEIQQSKQLDQSVVAAEETEKAIKKLLLLGAGESGAQSSKH